MRYLSSLRSLLALVAGLIGTASIGLAQPIILYAPSIPGRTLTVGAALSADGQYLVGYCRTNDDARAFRWRVGALTAEDLGSINGKSWATAASADGSVVVGGYDGPSGPRAFRWTSEAGMVDLGVLPGAAIAIPTAISGDGQVIVGYGQGAFRWTQESGMQALNLPVGAYQATPWAISGDASVIVGEYRVQPPAPAPQIIRALKWDSTGIATPLDSSGVSAEEASNATAVNADGSVIVGWIGNYSSAFDNRACQWMESGALNIPQFHVGNRSTDTTASGALTLLNSYDGVGPRLWWAIGGFQSLASRLSALGTNLNGVQFGEALAISGDGSVVMGKSSLTNGPTWVVIDLGGAIIPPEPCFGDANADEVVNFQDINAVIGNWGLSYSPATGPGDANLDGAVDFLDITQVLATWNYTCFVPNIP